MRHAKGPASVSFVFSHIDSLTYFMEPNYGLIYGTLRGLMKSKNLQEFPYDWENEYRVK